MVSQISPLEKIDSDRMIKESDAEQEVRNKKHQDQKDQKPPVHNNDSYIAPEKNQNDVLRRHE